MSNGRRCRKSRSQTDDSNWPSWPPHRFPCNFRRATRDARCTDRQIDLSAFYNAALTESWFGPEGSKNDNDLATLPSGLQIVDGTAFDIRGIVQLASTADARTRGFPREAGPVPVGQKCQRLHFLHSAGGPEKDGTVIGEYVIRFEDGTTESVPLNYAENTWNWWDIPGRTAPMKPGTTLAWRGRNPVSARSKIDVLLFHFRWENPRPEMSIASITFRSRMTHCAPFLLAITAE